MTTQKKNALIIAYNDLNNSGVPAIIYQTIKAMHNEFNFDIIVFQNDFYYYQKLIEEGIDNVNIISFHKDKPKHKLGRIKYEIISNPRFLYNKSKEIFVKKQYDVIHSFKEYDSWPILKAAKQIGIQNRIVHSNIIHSERENLLLKRNRRKTIKYATSFIGVSKDSCKYAWPGKESIVIHNGYDEFKYKLCESSLPNDELVIAHISTYSDNKNQLFSIELIKELKNLYPKAKLKIVGAIREEDYFSKMKKAIDEGGIQDSINIIDGSVGVESFPAKSTFYILPSKHEGASLVAIEAQACGIKVFASTGVPKEMNIGGITFLDLNDGAKKWAEVIYEEFKKSGNARTAYDTTSFSFENFKNNISKLYHK